MEELVPQELDIFPKRPFEFSKAWFNYGLRYEHRVEKAKAFHLVLYPYPKQDVTEEQKAATLRSWVTRAGLLNSEEVEHIPYSYLLQLAPYIAAYGPEGETIARILHFLIVISRANSLKYSTYLNQYAAKNEEGKKGPSYHAIINASAVMVSDMDLNRQLMHLKPAHNAFPYLNPDNLQDHRNMRLNDNINEDMSVSILVGMFSKHLVDRQIKIYDRTFKYSRKDNRILLKPLTDLQTLFPEQWKEISEQPILVSRIFSENVN